MLKYKNMSSLDGKLGVNDPTIMTLIAIRCIVRQEWMLTKSQTPGLSVVHSSRNKFVHQPLVGDSCWLARKTRHLSNMELSSTDNTVVPPEQVGTFQVQPALESSHNPTTKFADDTAGYEATLAAKSSLTKSFIDLITAPSSQSIIDYLQRPSIMVQGLLAATDSGILWSADVASMINSYKQTRMQNLYSFRCDWRITLQVNADRFQAGRYILAWLPSGGISGQTYTAGTSAGWWKAMHTANLCKITQLPHVEIDLAKQTHVTLDIPFTSAYPSIEWSTLSNAALQGQGLVFLYPYSPLNPGSGGANAGYVVWGSMQNIVLTAPTVSQMDVSTLEASRAGAGPISGVMAKVSEASNIIGEIPMLTSAMSQVSWLADVIGRSAKVFGFSKPLSQAAPQRMDRRLNPFSANYDNVALSKPLGLYSQNQVDVNPGISRTEVDEMSIDFIKSRYAYYTTNTWTTAMVLGASVFTIECIPINFSNPWSKGTVYTPVSFLANQFAKYRGGLKFRFKLVKTEFQRGRLVVAFAPTPYSGATINITSSELLFREVVDISTTSEFEVCVPYMINRPWQRYDQTIGTLKVMVENPLVAPSSVSSNVPILLEVCGDDDLEFACPLRWDVEPYAPSTSQMADPYVVTPCFRLGAATSKKDDVGKYTVGEAVHSVRQLLKRMMIMNPTSALTNIGNGVYALITAYAFTPVMQATGTSGALQRDSFYADPLTLWQGCYAFTTGGLRYMARTGVNSTGMLISASAENQPIPAGSYTSMYTTIPIIGYHANSWALQTMEGALEYQVPCWNGNLARATLNQIMNGGQTTPVALVEPFANSTYLIFGDSFYSTSTPVSLARSTADDHNMFCWVGCPPVVLTTTT